MINFTRKWEFHANDVCYMNTKKYILKIPVEIEVSIFDEITR